LTQTSQPPPEPTDVVPVTRASRARARSEDIVAAAAELFARNGYNNVGMRAVADAIGIRGASLYHHYSSKEEILYAIALSVTREPVEHHLPLLDAPGTPGERLAALVRAHLEHLSRRRVEHLVGLHEMSSLTLEHRQEIDEYRRYYQRRVHDVVAAGVRSGEFEVEDVHLAALAMLDMLNGISRWFSERGPLTVDQLADRYVTLIVDGLLRANRTGRRTTAGG
jgi:AcrR family transcriptional regulator